MKTQKQNYLSPVTETLVVRFEGVVCTSPSTWGPEDIWNVDDDSDGWV